MRVPAFHSTTHHLPDRSLAMSYSDLVLAQSPLFYYTLDESSGNFSDSGSVGVTATANGTGLLYDQADPFGGSAAIGLSATNYIEVPTATACDSLGAITVEVLAKWSAVQSGTVITGRWSGLGATLHWNLYTSVVYGGRAAFNCYLNSAQKVVNDQRTPHIDDGKWHHLVGVYDGSYVRLYVDSIDVGNAVAATGNLPASALPIRLGRLSDFNAWNFIGGISHVAIYGTALSSSVIADHAVEALGRPNTKLYSYSMLHNRYQL